MSVSEARHAESHDWGRKLMAREQTHFTQKNEAKVARGARLLLRVSMGRELHTVNLCRDCAETVPRLCRGCAEAVPRLCRDPSLENDPSSARRSRRVRRRAAS